MNKLEDIFRRFKNPYIKLLIGGATLSLLIFLFPSLYGEGYETIELLLNGTDSVEWGQPWRGRSFTAIRVCYSCILPW